MALVPVLIRQSILEGLSEGDDYMVQTSEKPNNMNNGKEWPKYR